MPQINVSLIIFYCIFTIVVFLVFPKKKKWYALLISSLLFYYLLIGVKVLFLLLFSLMIYSGGYLLTKYRKITPLIIICCLLPLMLSKILFEGNHFELYSNKHIEAPILFFSWSNLLKITGISYFTFNGISYLLDIKKNFLKPQKNFFLLTLYLFYFPAVFSGPLHRAKYLFSEFKKVNITNESISRGLRLILWGFFKNSVIAQRIYFILISLSTDEIGGFYYPLLGLLFFLYLYCNFSSFIDFFQGVSQLFNVELKDNFKNRIYFSSSRREFWKGWHITLNEWFRDYFFFAIAKKDKKRKYTNLFLLVTFILIALWHELSVVLLIWGVFNGLWIILETKFLKKQKSTSRIRKIGGIVYHLFFSSILALIFISRDLNSLITKLFLKETMISMPVLKENQLNILVVLFCFWIMDYHSRKATKKRFDLYLNDKNWIKRWFIYIKLIAVILLFGLSSEIDNYYTLF